MPTIAPVAGPDSFTTFGDFLYYLRRRARLKQRDLAIATDYSEAQISRLEKNQRFPDQATLLSLFVPALGLEREPELAARLLVLATESRERAARSKAMASDEPAPSAPPPAARPGPPLALEPIPAPAPSEVLRPSALTRLRERLGAYRHIALCGMGGVGKTTLAAALARDYVTRAPVFWLTLSDPSARSVESLIAQLAEFLSAYVPTLVAPLLGVRVGSDAPFAFDQQISLLSSALAACAASRPAPPLICLDNFHLAQDDLQFGALLRQLMASSPAAILLLSRETVALSSITSVILEGLEQAEAQLMLSQLGGSDLALSPAVTKSLLARTAGNPMLLRLVLGSLIDQRADPAALVARLESAPQIAAYLLEAVVQRLSPAGRTLLALLAVIGSPLNLYDEAFLELCRAEQDLGAIGPAVGELQRQLLVSDPASAVLHPLLRDQIYASLLPDLALRRRLHQLAASWAARTQSDMLLAADHYMRAGSLDQAVRLISSQVDTISAQGQALAAIHVVNELLAQARLAGGAQASQLLLARADLLAQSLRTGEAEASYRAALDAASTPAAQAQIRIRLAFSLAQRGQARQALYECAAARALLSPLDTQLLVDLAASEAWAYRNLAQYAEVSRVVQIGLPLAEHLMASEPGAASRMRAVLHANSAYVCYARRQMTAAREQIKQAIAAAEQAGNRRLVDLYRGGLGQILICDGDPAGGLRIIEELLPAARLSGDIFALEYLLLLHALGLYLRGELGVARDALEAALALRHALGIYMDASTADGHYLALMIGLGRADEARTLIDQLLARVEPGGAWRDLGYLLNRRAALHLLAGNPLAAQADLRQALELPAAYDDPRLFADSTTYLGMALLVGGTPTKAGQLLADDPPPAAGVWAALERGLARAMLAWAEGDRLATRAHAYAVATRAEASGHRLYQGVADRLIAALAQPISLRQLPQLLWIHGWAEQVALSPSDALAGREEKSLAGHAL